jgi:hypothetical protein
MRSRMWRRPRMLPPQWLSAMEHSMRSSHEGYDDIRHGRPSATANHFDLAATMTAAAAHRCPPARAVVTAADHVRRGDNGHGRRRFLA